MRYTSENMANRLITQEMYDILLQAFREQPANASHAARMADCDPRMARRGWHKGWDYVTWAKPIKDVILDERRQARAKAWQAEQDLRVKAHDVRLKAQQDAVDVMASESQMLKLGRQSVTSALAVTGVLWPAVRKLAEEMKQRVEAGTEKISPREALAFFRTYTWIVNMGVSAAGTLVDAERRKNGEPTEIIEFRDGEGMSLEEAVEELSHVQELIEQARQRGLVPATSEAVGDGLESDKPNGTN